MTIPLRVARPDDLDGIVSVFLACWRGSYAGLLPDEVLGRLDDADARELWRAGLATGTTLVAVDDRIRGVLRWRADAEGGRIESLYVDPDAQGGGVGAALIGAAESGMREAGIRAARLNVFAANAPAIRFYSRHGWAETGQRRTDPRYGAPELVLSKELS